MIEMNYKFSNTLLLDIALTHKSYQYENKDKLDFNNERLEFLGDSVLDLVISEKLMDLYPGLSEGDLTKLRAGLVNESSLFDVATELSLDKTIKLGKGEIKNWERGQKRLMGSTLEAIIGAMFTDSGYEKSKEEVLRFFKNKLKQINLDDVDEQDFKSKLQERIQKDFDQTPVYSVVGETGEDHLKIFTLDVKVGEKVLATASGSSKKIASQNAAKKALEVL